MINECIGVNSLIKDDLILNNDNTNEKEPSNECKLFSNKQPSIFAKTYLQSKNESVILHSPVVSYLNDNNKTYSKVVNEIREINKRIAEDEYYKSIVNHEAKMSSQIIIGDEKIESFKQFKMHDDTDKKPIMTDNNKKKVLSGKKTNSASIDYKQPCIVNFFKK